MGSVTHAGPAENFDGRPAAEPRGTSCSPGPRQRLQCWESTRRGTATGNPTHQAPKNHCGHTHTHTQTGKHFAPQGAVGDALTFSLPRPANPHTQLHTTCTWPQVQYLDVIASACGQAGGCNTCVRGQRGAEWGGDCRETPAPAGRGGRQGERTPSRSPGV